MAGTRVVLPVRLFQTLTYDLGVFQTLVFQLELLLLSRFGCVRLCATPWAAAHQAQVLPTLRKKSGPLFQPNCSILTNLQRCRFLLFIFACLGSALGNPSISSLTVEKWQSAWSRRLTLCLISASWLLQAPFEFLFPMLFIGPAIRFRNYCSKSHQ